MTDTASEQVAQQLDEQVLVSKERFRIMSCFEWALPLMARLTTDPKAAR